MKTALEIADDPHAPEWDEIADNVAQDITRAETIDLPARPDVYLDGKAATAAMIVGACIVAGMLVATVAIIIHALK